MITDGKVYRPEQAERAFVELMALLDSNCDRPSPSRCRTWASTTVKSLDGHPLWDTVPLRAWLRPARTQYADG